MRCQAPSVADARRRREGLKGLTMLQHRVCRVQQLDGDHDERLLMTASSVCWSGALRWKGTPRRQELMAYRDHHTDPMQEIARLFRGLRKPVIGQVHGYAVGGGCELAMLCDMRVAAAGTKFGFTEVRVGATVTMGGLYNLARIVGLGRAFELLYTTEMIDAEEAYRERSSKNGLGRV